MKALDIFKKAGIEDYIAPGLIGAGAGGLGMGLVSSLKNQDGETPEERKKRILTNALLGAGLGGSAGLGYQALKDFAGHDDLPAKVREAVNAARDKGVDVDSSPYGKNHPIGQIIHDATHAPLAAGAGVGAGLGILGHAKAEHAANGAFDAVMQKTDEARKKYFDELSKNDTAYKDVSSGLQKAQQQAGKIMSFGPKGKNPLPQDIIDHINQQGQRLDTQLSDLKNILQQSQAQRGAPFNATVEASKILGDHGITNPEVRKLVMERISRIDPSAYGSNDPVHFYSQVAENSGFGGAKAGLGKANLAQEMGRDLAFTRKLDESGLGHATSIMPRIGTALEHTRNYGIPALVAGGLVAGAQGLGRMANDAVIRTGTTPEQLKVWNSWNPNSQ